MATHAFIARQPIFDAHRAVVAYELLFRSGEKNACPDVDPDMATSHVLGEGALLFGMEELTAGRPAFVNLTRKALLAESATLWPSDRIVAEVLENVAPTPDVVHACRQLRERGYTIALDDYVDGPEYAPLLDVAHIVKVDFLQSDAAERARLAARFVPLGIRLLAEKVETPAEYDEARALGYELFQGYFFERPTVMSRQRLDAGQQGALQLLRLGSAEELDIAAIEAVFRQDVALSYKLLRHANSAWFSWKSEIRSIRHAVTNLGRREFQKWAAVVATGTLGADKPRELTVSALQRAFCLGSLARLVGDERQAEPMFLLGMFSLIDALTGRPRDEVLAELALSPAIKAALTGGTGRPHAALQCVIAMERGDWPALSLHATEAGLPEDAVARAYREAIRDVAQLLPA